ncbi:hypothetical protein HDU85_004140 [Gaertneriomyces sp. JEL0708]|nr:hypothetical protein HDU85_004140 [Gaertneriomyces sp. JEL0708]
MLTTTQQLQHQPPAFERMETIDAAEALVELRGMDRWEAPSGNAGDSVVPSTTQQSMNDTSDETSASRSKSIAQAPDLLSVDGSIDLSAWRLKNYEKGRGGGMRGRKRYRAAGGNNSVSLGPIDPINPTGIIPLEGGRLPPIRSLDPPRPYPQGPHVNPRVTSRSSMNISVPRRTNTSRDSFSSDTLAPITNNQNGINGIRLPRLTPPIPPPSLPALIAPAVESNLSPQNLLAPSTQHQHQSQHQHTVWGYRDRHLSISTETDEEVSPRNTPAQSYPGNERGARPVRTYTPVPPYATHYSHAPYGPPPSNTYMPSQMGHHTQAYPPPSQHHYPPSSSYAPPSYYGYALPNLHSLSMGGNPPDEPHEGMHGIRNEDKHTRTIHRLSSFLRERRESQSGGLSRRR